MYQVIIQIYLMKIFNTQFNAQNDGNPKKKHNQLITRGQTDGYATLPK